MPCLIIRSDGRKLQSEGEASFRTGVQGGACAWWQWDGRELKAGSEPWGFYPLYLLQQPGVIGIATSIVELLPFLEDRALDETALAVFLRLGYHMGQDTPWRAIRAFPAASAISWVPGQAPRVLDEFVPQEACTLPRQAIIRRYLELFEASIAASAPSNPVVVPLSGGRDSRHILFELLRAGRKVERVFTTWRGDDIDAARRVARATGMRHQVCRQRGNMRDELRKNVLTSFCSDEHGWVIPAIDALGEQPLSLYDGIAGGMLSAGAFLRDEDVRDFRDGRFGKLARRFLVRRHRRLQRVGDVARHFPLEAAVARVEAEMRRLAGRVNGVTEFYLWNRTRREITLYTFEMLGMRHEVHAPYLSRELVGFLLSLPPEEVIGKGLHTETIATGYPRYAGVPYEKRTGLKRQLRRVAALRPSMYFEARSVLADLRGELLGPRELRRMAFHCAVDERIREYVGAPLCIAQLTQWPVERMQLEYVTRGWLPRGQASAAQAGLEKVPGS